MIRYIYDIECLKNLFTATFVNPEDEADTRIFYIGLGNENYTDLLKFLRQDMTLVGYNNHSYDDPMLRFIMTYRGERLNTELYNLSGKLIDENFRADKKLLELRYPKKQIYSWRSIDLMRILAFDKLGISLKQVAINLKWHKIQDMPVHYKTSVQDVQLPDILSYNLNDVLITKRLYDDIKPLRDMRDDLSKIYNVDLSSASDSKMANLILENIYGTEMKMDVRSIRDMRTYREKILLGSCIAHFVKFETPELNALLDRISSTYVYAYNEFKYAERIFFANCVFNLGIGGLHSEDPAGMFVSDDKHLIQDMDVASYYPTLIINNGFYPEHLGKDFIRVLKRITEERLAAKKAKDKVKADGLKITVNSIFGKFGSQHFWLMDAKQLLSTTLTGQLGLLMLIEGLYLAGIPVISCNTDGIVCQIPRELEDKYYEVAHAWEKATQCQLEYTPYKKYVRRDVNSYITEKEDGSTKEKGAFLKTVDLKKAYHMPIVAKVLYAYYIKGTPIRAALEECKDIMEFCISQKTGNDFEVELHTGTNIEKLQKTNRFYITRKGGQLLKRRTGELKKGSTIGLYVGKQVRILNDFDASIPFKDYDVDLNFYEKEVMKIVDEIEPKQLTLFELPVMDTGVLTKMPVKPAAPVLNEGKLSVEEINKLGKNQRSRKIETIVTNREVLETISPRYLYIMGFNAKLMLAEVYCLAKGVIRQMDVNKAAYKKVQLKNGDLIYCSKFEKVDGGHSMVEYKIADKIEQQIPVLMSENS
jgi:hypothetical protein